MSFGNIVFNIMSILVNIKSLASVDFCDSQDKIRIQVLVYINIVLYYLLYLVRVHLVDCFLTYFA